MKNNASQCPRLSWIEIPKNAYETLLQFQSSYMNYTTKTVCTQLKSRLFPGGFRRLTAIYIHYISPAFQKNNMGPTGKGTSIGIKSNITITSLLKQPAYYFLRISPKISPRISVNIFITSLSYPHPSVHHQSSRASFKILPRIFMSINITSITPVSKITYQEYPAKSSCLKSRLQTSPLSHLLFIPTD